MAGYVGWFAYRYLIFEYPSINKPNFTAFNVISKSFKLFYPKVSNQISPHSKRHLTF